MQVYIYIFIILIVRAAASLQNGQSYFHNRCKIGHFPVFIGCRSVCFRVCYVQMLECPILYIYSCMNKKLYQNIFVIFFIDIHVGIYNITEPNQGCICHTLRR